MILKITLIGLMAGVLGTGLGGVLSGIFKKKVDKYIDFFMGLSGGIMLAVVVFDLMKEAIDQKGIWITVIATLLGVIITMLIKENLHMSKDKQAGYLIFISILLHNLPEGLAIGQPCSEIFSHFVGRLLTGRSAHRHHSLGLFLPQSLL